MANIQDPEARGTMIFAWWMACMCDAYASVYYRRKPVLDDDDYDIDFYTADPIQDVAESHNSMPSPREQLEVRYFYFLKALVHFGPFLDLVSGKTVCVATSHRY